MSDRLLVVAFEGWNDAGEAATGALGVLRESLGSVPISALDPELYYDYQFTRPTIFLNEAGVRELRWPGAEVLGPAPEAPIVPDAADAVDAPDVPDVPGTADAARESGTAADRPGEAVAGDAENSSLMPNSQVDNDENVYLLLGAEPSRSWQAFVSEVLDTALAVDISRIIVVGAVLADSPHSRPISVELRSDNADIRAELDIERSSYEGPVGILNVLCCAAEAVGIPTMSVWASVPHYVHSAPSPKAVLALVDRLEELIGVVIPRGALVAEAQAWQVGVDALAAEDPDLSAYIAQLERARDTVEAPEASGEAIAQEFQRFLGREAAQAEGADDAEGPRGTEGIAETEGSEGTEGTGTEGTEGTGTEGTGAD